VVLLNGADDHGILHWGTLTRKLLTKKKKKKWDKKKKKKKKKKKVVPDEWSI